MVVADDQEEFIRITPKTRARLREYNDKTGVGINKLLKNAKKIPQGLTVGKLQGWLSGTTKKARKDYMSFVLKEWQKYPQHEFVYVAEEQRKELLHHRKRTGLSPRVLLWKHREENPEGLSDSLVDGWMKGRKTKTPKSYIEYVLKCWKSQPDENQLYLFSDKKIQKELKQALKAARLSVHHLLLLRKDVPRGLNKEKIDRWMAGKTKRINRAEYDYFIQICHESAKNPPIDRGPMQLQRFGKKRVVIEEDYIQSLKKEIARTGHLPWSALKYHSTFDQSKDMVVKGWLSGKTKTATQDDLNAILEIYRKLPDRQTNSTVTKGPKTAVNNEHIKSNPIGREGYAPIIELQRKKLQHYQDKTNMLPSFVFTKSRSDDIPRGLTPTMVKAWISGTTKTADPEHVKWVLNRCKELLLEALEE